MRPHLPLATCYLVMALAWLHLGLLEINNGQPIHRVSGLVQCAGAITAAVGALFLARRAGFLLQSLGLVTIAMAGIVVALLEAPERALLAATKAAQGIGLLLAVLYLARWWRTGNGPRNARPLAAGFFLASIASFVLVGLEFTGHGHPYQVEQRAWAAADDGLHGLALLFAAWIAGLAALTISSPRAGTSAAWRTRA